MSAKRHYETAEAQLRKKFRSRFKGRKRFCFEGGASVLLLGGRCDIEDCKRRGSPGCLEDPSLWEEEEEDD